MDRQMMSKMASSCYFSHDKKSNKLLREPDIISAVIYE